VRRQRGVGSAIVTGATLGVLVLAARPASAADIRVERADGAEACPDPNAFQARIREIWSRSSRDLSIRFGPTRKGFAATVRTSDGMMRSLEDDSCDALADATLVVVRLAAEEPASGEREAPVVPPPTSSSAGLEPAPERDEARAADARSRAWLGGELLLGAAAAIGLQGGLGGGARASGALVFGGGRFSLGLTGLWLAPVASSPGSSSAGSPAGSSAGSGKIEVGILGGGLEACARAAVAARMVSFAVCPRGEVFRLSGEASGFARNESRGRALIAASLVLRGKVRIAGPAGVFVEAAATFPLTNERFAVDGLGIVYDPPVLAGIGAAGLALEFE